MDRKMEPNRNLLIHSYFGIPVNRRYNYDTPYSIGRWVTAKMGLSETRAYVKALPDCNALLFLPYRLESRRDRLRRDAAGRAVYAGMKLKQKFPVRGGAKCPAPA